MAPENVKNLILKNKKILKIFLKRNFVDIFISHVIAKNTNIWVTTCKHIQSKSKINIDINQFDNVFTFYNNWFKFICNNTEKIIIINYDEIIGDDKISKIITITKKNDIHLDKFDYNTVKQIPIKLDNRGLKDKIHNYDEFIYYLQSNNIPYKN